MRLCCSRYGFALIFFGVLGCGGGSATTATVVGRVMHHGKPVPGGSITFAATDDRRMTGPIKADGSFLITDVPLGSLQVAVETETARRFANLQPLDGQSGQASLMPGYLPLPPSFADTATSGLNARVEPGGSTLVIEVP